MPNGYEERDIPIEQDAYPPEYLEEADAILNGLIERGAPAPQQMPQRIPGRGFARIESYNPETGETQITTGVERRPSLPQFPIPRPRRDPMEEMRKTINAIQFQKANDAYKAALSFQAARAYRQDLDAGKSQGEALARWGHLLPGGLAGAARMTEASRPAFTPTPLPGNTNLYRVGPRGERLFQYRPETVVPEGPLQTRPFLTPEGVPIPNRYGYPTKGGVHVLTGEQEAKLTPQGQLKYYDNRIKALQTERANLNVDAAGVERRKQLDTEITDLQQKQQELFEKHSKKGGKAEAAAPKGEQPKAPKGSNEVTRFTKDGRRAIFDATTKKFLRYAND